MKLFVNVVWVVCGVCALAGVGRQGGALAAPAESPIPARPEEIAFAQQWIDAAQIQKLAAPLAKNGYGQYLLGLLK